MTTSQKLRQIPYRFRHGFRLFKIRNRFIYEGIKFLFFSLLIILITAKGINGLDYRWQWYRIPDYILKTTSSGTVPGPLLSGLRLTITVSALSLVCSTVAGFITAFLRLSNSVTAVIVSRLYLEIIRNTPLLIQLFLVYFVVAPILGIGRMTSAILTLSMFEGAYISEIIRSGIISVERGQWEAAHSIGLSTVQTYRIVILPQALRQILPVLASQAISLVKDSALVSTIAIYELTMRGQVSISESFLTFEIWFTVAAIYLIINTGLSLLIRIFEGRLKRAFA